MSDQQQNMVHFAIIIDGEVAQKLSMFENSRALVAALSSDPKIVLIPSGLEYEINTDDVNNPWTYDGTEFIPPRY